MDFMTIALSPSTTNSSNLASTANSSALRHASALASSLSLTTGPLADKAAITSPLVLQISRERKVEKEEKKDTWHRVERSSGKFLRRFRLPKNAKMDQIKAAMENGVLTVTVPKVEAKKPDVKTIEISC
ncbi:hypothetical protein RGQ29_030801 [Quercus rubra]|uniref:SHSP domain-containing protein n=1 Tax=Quercus rubra TaxID=3512 RepID=A0AAN7EK94_QUERU|nr:hypothetical protein RGQ29_030801 [Quercus rubra]